MSEILYKGLAAPLKLDAEEWIASLKDDGGEWLADDKIAKIIAAKFTEAATAATEAARKSGQSEETKRLKRLVKKAGFENPDNLIGDALFDAFNTWKDEQVEPPDTTGVTNPDQMSREDLAKLPIVKLLISEAVQAGAGKYEALKKDHDSKLLEFEQYKSGVIETNVKSVARGRFKKALEKGRVVLKVEGLEVDPEERVDAAFERFWNRNKVGLDKSGEPIILNDDGEQKTDPAFGKPLEFDEIAVSIARPMYGVSTQDPTHEGANPPQNGSHGQNGAYVPKYRFRDQVEYDKFKMETVDGAERLEATKSWQFAQEKAAGN